MSFRNAAMPCSIRWMPCWAQVDAPPLRKLLISQAPQKGIRLFPLDSSCWAHPHSRALEDLQYVYQPSSDGDGRKVTVGYPYSLLERWAQPKSRHWRKRAPTARQPWILSWQTGKYSNVRFLARVSGLRVGMVSSERMFYRPAQPTLGKRGRPPKYGERFALKGGHSWDEPDEAWGILEAML